MTATPNIDGTPQALNVQLHTGQKSQNILSAISSGGSPIDFSSGWDFGLYYQAAFSANGPPAQLVNCVITGDNAGVLTAKFAGGASVEPQCQQSTFIISGTTDSGVTYVVLAQGTLSVATP